MSLRPGDLAPERSADPAAPFYRCPVRHRYAWQLARYAAPLGRWRRALHAADAGEPGTREATLVRLVSLLRTAEVETGHYPGAFAAAGVTWRDLERIEQLAAFPALSRRALQERFHDLFSRRATRGRVFEGWLGRSSGSTGEPVRFFMDALSIHFTLALVRFLWERFRLGPLPRPGSTGIVLVCTLPRSALYGTWLPLLNGTRFRKLHLDEPRAAAELTRLAPAVVTGDPDSLARLCAELEAGRARIAPRLVLSSAWALPASLAAGLAEATGARVVDTYSLAETGPVGWSCEPGSGRFHLLAPAAVLEADEAGELLLTNLRNELFPLVRYRTGDVGAVEEPDGPCPRCGARGPVLSRLEGRTVSRFLAADGRRVDPSQLQPLLVRLGLEQFRLVQTDLSTVVLDHVAAGELPGGAAVELTAALRRLLGEGTRLCLRRSQHPLFAPGEKPVVYRCDAARGARGAGEKTRPGAGA